MKNFGVKRVMEPKGTVPVTAWRVDNSKELKESEIRINLEMLHVEWDNFNQLCSHCGYDETRIKARIIQIVNERGKFHNPYTGSGGIFMGVIDEIAPEASDRGFACGERVVGLTTMTGVAAHIDSISNIDYNYGQVECSGYVICFESTVIRKFDSDVDAKYLLTALDEGGNFLGVYDKIKNSSAESVAIIGGNFVTTLLYAQTIKDCYGPEPRVIAVMDRESLKVLDEDDVDSFFGGIIERVYFVDLSLPVDVCKDVYDEEGQSYRYDAVINLSDVPGSETVAIMMVKDGGMVFYTSLMESYPTGLLVADSIGKEVIPFAMDGYSRGAYDFAVNLIKKIEPNLKQLDAVYKSKDNARFDVKGDDGILKIIAAADRMEDFVYRSPVTRAMLDEALNVAKYDCSVIIQGETGVGKEKVFNLIHQNSPRHGKPCVKINCATIQESLAESEFFGYEKGSFTGAQSTGKAGYFELANNGTLFLDEIGSLSIGMQSKLLRVLQENSYYRVGGTEQKHVNVRVVCANNVPLKELVKEGKFREDLFYRLNICEITVPPLRNRREDIIVLSTSFIKNYSKKYGMEKEISPEALKVLESYNWPGNVRELENIIHRLYISARDRIVGVDSVLQLLNNDTYQDLIVNIAQEAEKSETIDFNQLIEEQEKRLIAYALEREGTTRKAAEFLNIPQATFARKKVKYNL